MTDAKILVIDDNTAVLSTLEHIDSGYVPAFEAWVAHLN